LEEGKPGRLRVYYNQTLENGEVKELFEECNTVFICHRTGSVHRRIAFRQGGNKIKSEKWKNTNKI